MKKWKKRSLKALLFLMLCGMLTGMTGRASQPEIDGVKDKIDSLNGRKEDSKRRMDSLEEEKKTISEELLELNEKLTRLARELTATGEELEAARQAVAETEQKLKTARQKEQKQYEDMKKRIRFLYERGELSLLETLLEAEGIADFLSRSEYVLRIHEYDRDKLEEYQKTKQAVAARKQELEQKQRRIEALKEQQETQMAQAEVLIADTEAKMEDTNRRIARTQEEVDQYEAAIAKQKAYEEQLEKQKAAEDERRLEEIRKQEEEIRKQEEQRQEEKERQEEKRQTENQPPPSAGSGSKSDVSLLAALIECEAGGESYEGKMAVGSVVANRVKSSHFPNTVFEVIYQSGQFAPVESGRFASVLARGAQSDCRSAAEEVLSGNVTVQCLYFRKNNGEIPGTVIGNHVFY